VGEYQSTDIQFGTMGADFVQAEMEIKVAIEEGALAGKEVSAGDVCREPGEPSGVPRVSDPGPADIDPVAVGIGLELVLGFESRDLRRAELLLGSSPDFVKSDDEGPLVGIHTVPHGRGEGADLGLDARWANDGEGLLAVIFVKRRQQVERDAAEVRMVSISFRSIPNCTRPVLVVAPQSIRRVPRGPRTRIADCRRPPAPNASLVPTKITSSIV